ncbi:carotenoid biosynthesis protein [Chitinophaga japonensis]|nr:carotenoid biosynthesis protein [Chitinophaga japonensis]
MYLLGGLGFGLLLEYVNVAANVGYRYGQFGVMLGSAPRNIPLCIGTGWAIIIYTARLVTDALGMPVWAAAALDALLAVNIDLSMDVVAYRLHMWHWDWESRGPQYNVLTSQWFGIPYGNFYGWLCVVFYYSLFARLLEKISIRKPPVRTLWRMATPLISILVSQAALWLSLFTIADWLKQFGITTAHRLVALLLLFTFMAITGFTKRKITSASNAALPLVTWLVPTWFHLYFFSWFFIAGFYRENAWMTVCAVANLLLGAFIHWLLWIQLKRSAAPVMEVAGT